jgi:hypothetical protein
MPERWGLAKTLGPDAADWLTKDERQVFTG